MFDIYRRIWWINFYVFRTIIYTLSWPTPPSKTQQQSRPTKPTSQVETHAYTETHAHAETHAEAETHAHAEAHAQAVMAESSDGRVAFGEQNGE